MVSAAGDKPSTEDWYKWLQQQHVADTAQREERQRELAAQAEANRLAAAAAAAKREVCAHARTAAVEWDFAGTALD